MQRSCCYGVPRALIDYAAQFAALAPGQAAGWGERHIHLQAQAFAKALTQHVPIDAGLLGCRRGDFQVNLQGIQVFLTSNDNLVVRRDAGEADQEEDDDDLGPVWFAAQLDARKDDSLRDFGRWLAEMMVMRAQRVALTKMDYTPSTGRFWIPSRIRERAGLISRLSTEGWFDVGLRIDSLSSVLSGCGVIERNQDGVWSVTEDGEALLA